MEQKQNYPSKWHLCFSALLKSMYLLYSTTGVKHKKHKVIPNLISCFWCCLFQEGYFPVGKIWDDTWEPTSEFQQHFAWCAASFSQRVFSLCWSFFYVTNKSHIISADCTCVLSAGNSVINMWSQRSIQIPHWSPTGCRHFKHFDWLQVSDTHLYLFKCIVLCRNLYLMLLTALVV